MASPSALSHYGPFMPSILVPHGRPLYITKFGCQMRWSHGPLWNIAEKILPTRFYLIDASLLWIRDDSLAQADQKLQILSSNISPVQPILIVFASFETYNPGLYSLDFSFTPLIFKTPTWVAQSFQRSKAFPAQHFKQFHSPPKT